MQEGAPELIRIPSSLPWSEQWDVRDSDGVAVNVTGFTYVFEVREKSGSSVTTGTVTLSSPTTGGITVSLSEAQTAALEGRVLHWTLTETDTLSNETLVAYGPIEIIDMT